MSEQNPPTRIGRLERILAYMIGAVLLISVVCMVAILIASAAGVGNNDGFSSGAWPLIIVLPFPGLITGFILMFALLAITAVKRAKAAKDDGR